MAQTEICANATQCNTASKKMSVEGARWQYYTTIAYIFILHQTLQGKI